MNRTFDALILGAGPAGSALAVHLARAGFDVALADQKAFPRPKPCGEFLSPQCRPYLAELGVEGSLLQLGARMVHGMTLNQGARRAQGSFRQLPDAPHSAAGYCVRREVLDLELMRAAVARPEVTWLERHRFVGLRRDRDGTVTGASLLAPDGQAMQVQARVTIGADGVRSRLARELGVQRPIAWLDRMALVTRFGPVEPHARAEVHFVDGAYFAATTVDDGTFHLNLVMDRADLRSEVASLDEIAAARLEQAPALALRLKDAHRLEPWRGIGPLAHTTTRQAVPGAALVGDAAGYVDPLTGEGVYFALFGAQALARRLVEARACPGKSAAAMRAYEKDRRREVLPRLWLARLIQRGMRQPWIVDGALRILARNPRFCDLLINLTGDAVHPTELLKPGFWRRWRLAGGAA